MRLDPCRLWFDLYYFATVEEIRPTNVISQSQRKTFVQQQFRITQRYGWTTEQFANAVLFYYLHNPLELEDPREFGSFSNFGKSAPKFQRFLYDYRTSITSLGLTRAIRSTMPHAEEAQTTLETILNQYKND